MQIFTRISLARKHLLIFQMINFIKKKVAIHYTDLSEKHVQCSQALKENERKRGINVIAFTCHK